MTNEELATGRPTMREARAAALTFLEESLAEATRFNIVKLAPLDGQDARWEVEADVWQPNPTIQALQLPTERQVVDQERYLLRLDNRLNVVAYGLKEAFSEA